MSNQLEQYYKEYHAKMGDIGYTGDRNSATSRFLLFKEWIGQHVPKGGRILDIGCGSATFAAQSPDYEWYGMDWDVSKAEGKPIQAIVHNIEEQPYPYESGSFDAITCSEVAEHVVHPINIYKEVRRLLKRDGTFFLSTPNHLWLQNLLTGHQNLVYDPEMSHTVEHIRTYTLESHKKCLSFVGLVIEEHVGVDAHYCGIVNPMLMGVLKMLQDKYGVSPTPAEMHLAAGRAHPHVQHTVALRIKKV